MYILYKFRYIFPHSYAFDAIIIECLIDICNKRIIRRSYRIGKMILNQRSNKIHYTYYMDGSNDTVAVRVAVAAFCDLAAVAMFAVFVAVAETNQSNH